MAEKSKKFDICVIGSGAGAGPVIYELSKAGYSVVVLEKGPWYRTKDFTKDEVTAVRRSVYTPNLLDEPQVIEDVDDKGNWFGRSTYDTGNDFWNGNCVGGSSNFMSGYFQRFKPIDFRLLSEFGAIKGANIVDWPIEYGDMEPYYTKVEKIVGVSGKVINHSQLEPRSMKPVKKLALRLSQCQELFFLNQKMIETPVFTQIIAEVMAVLQMQKEVQESHYCTML